MPFFALFLPYLLHLSKKSTTFKMWKGNNGYFETHFFGC
ncbi:hypothetical protein PEPS_41520 (plasmid) [Persicobacter psychrovividus]|uniref:Uncharacterized protein n=1 Tax=Persicobacter psychrovividus TaxID=387638 RepID=A0ABM7VLU1_9BACT|nr:hypothetical protein PEPS_41520 [Persicobacter psychrovividus]